MNRLNVRASTDRDHNPKIDGYFQSFGRTRESREDRILLKESDERRGKSHQVVNRCQRYTFDELKGNEANHDQQHVKVQDHKDAAFSNQRR